MKYLVRSKYFSLLIFLMVISFFKLYAQKNDISPLSASQQSNDLKLWYLQPAANWNEALPVGNGRLGAMVFGRVENERIQLNEESLWAGKQIDVNNPGAANHLKEIQQLLLNGENKRANDLSTQYLLQTPPRFRSYQTLGDLFLDFGEQGGIKNYNYQLDLKTGIVTTGYEINGVKFKREVFASAPQNCIVIRLTSNKANSIQCKLNLSRERDATVSAVGNSQLLMSGQIADANDVMNGEGGLNMKFHTLLQAKQVGGKILAKNNTLLIQQATSVTILITAATDYNFSKLNFDRSIDSKAICEKIISKAIAIPVNELQKKHLAEFQSFFNRVQLNLGNINRTGIPTDKRLDSLKLGIEDPQLMALYFQYGRYLLMSSSRYPGVLPANLQGVWNEHFNAPWESDYHTNINLQMNYWPAEICNLSETTTPLFNFIDNYRVPGRVTAKKMYNSNGWMMHHATDIFGKTGINAGIHWGTSPLSAAWLCQHLWEHYLFTLDNDFLKNKAYPIMKEAAQFIQSFLIKDKHGYLVTAPSMSPENAFKLPNGELQNLTYSPTIDIEMIMDFYSACINAGNILQDDQQFLTGLNNTLKQLPPISISKRYGTIQEWIEDYEEVEPGHRHISHLFGLHPANIINQQTPELFEAAKKTLERRLQNGGGHTGWSRAWIINFYARLQDGEKAYQHVLALLQKSTLKNLFDNHPPFQIDGNFGGTAGIAEMLLQSQNETIQLLPALPNAWKNGNVKGLCARGGFVIDMEWNSGKLTKAIIFSKKGGDCNINTGSKKIQLKTEAGKQYVINSD